MKIFLVTAVLMTQLSIFSDLSAQKNYNKKINKYWTVGLFGGAGTYYGDLAPVTDALSFNPSLAGAVVGFDASKRLSPRFSLRTGLTWSRIKGSDFLSADPTDPASLGRYFRNLHFRNDLFELSGVCTFDFVANTGAFSDRKRVTPYAFVGLSVFYHSPMAKVTNEPLSLTGLTAEEEARLTSLAGEWVALHPLRTEEQVYSTLQIAVPFGLGIKAAVSDKFNIGFEVFLKQTFTDYLDDVSADRYADLSGDPLRKLMANRTWETTDALGNGDRNLAQILADNGQGIVDHTYTDGTGYKTIGGYSHLNGSEKRGDPNDNDQLAGITLRLEFILGSGYGEARFRDK